MVSHRLVGSKNYRDISLGEGLNYRMSNKVLTVAIDLTWVRVGIVGGTESFVRNLLKGLAELGSDKIRAYLLLARDNYDSFSEYKNYDNLKLVKCHVESMNQVKRIIWQNTVLGKILRKLKVTKCLEPVYICPYMKPRGIDFYTVIHDLQAMHYPEYFGRARVLWMRISWLNAVLQAKYIIAISDYVKKDILTHYPKSKNKIKTIYNAINVDTGEADETVLEKLGLGQGGYYYSISNFYYHKNLKTLIEIVRLMREEHKDIFKPLVISGIQYSKETEISDLRGKNEASLRKMIADYGLTEDIIFVGFVSNGERNALYRKCKAFIFPSMFEGFGMPLIEAIKLGAPVLTTRATSIPEVTEEMVNYVGDPLDPDEYVKKLQEELKKPKENDVARLTEKYSPINIAGQYVRLLGEYSESGDI